MKTTYTLYRIRKSDGQTEAIASGLSNKESLRRWELEPKKEGYVIVREKE